MAGLSSPLRLAPPMTPRRAPSPTMSPGGRRGRTLGSSEEGRLRDLSPETTLRAFTQKPVPFDTTCDEYKIFACIDSLTAAERELGARVARAAQRLKSWCSEIQQWGWSGSFEPPTDEFRQQRRRSLELRIREHVGDADISSSLPPLEYWGSLLSVEVESHEARLDDIAEEMLTLDIEELKEHVLDMHPAGRSRPSSAGYEATRQNYKHMDDFSILITQTLLSALPHHAQLSERLGTWTARITTLREVPRYLDDLKTAQKAMRLAWDAIDPPSDNSNAAFAQWKEAVSTITNVLRDKVGDLGKRLDRMLDTLESREDCIPDKWIDIFEGIERDYGQWNHESRSRILDFDVRRKWEQRAPAPPSGNITVQETHIPLPSSEQDLEAAAVLPVASEAVANVGHGGNDNTTSDINEPSSTTDLVQPSGAAVANNQTVAEAKPVPPRDAQETSGPSKNVIRATNGSDVKHHELRFESSTAGAVRGTPTTPRFATVPTPTSSAQRAKPWFFAESSTPSTPATPLKTEHIKPTRTKPSSATLEEAGVDNSSRVLQSATHAVLFEPLVEVPPSVPDDESDFDEGDTVIHNDLDEEDVHDAPKLVTDVVGTQDDANDTPHDAQPRKRPSNISTNPVIITNDGEHGTLEEPPQTPKSRRDSTGSISSDMSVDSSPPSTLDDSPSVRNATNRAIRAPRPELNAAMSKRRTGKAAKDKDISNPPWPPTQFQNSGNSADDLERKISDILTTIPAHIRLTSGPGADAPEVKPRGVSARGSRQYLRAARSASGLKSPELTLSPAKSDFDSGNAASGRRSAATSRVDDIKLYHLTQPGKEQPVKLFIRRVGENGERVMVRVGGGWADLGEYLRQYAEHHGRRTASDGKFEILGLEVKNSDNMTSPNRPESVMSRGDRQFSSSYQATSPTTTPVKAAGPSVLKDDSPPGVNTTPVAEGATVPSTNSSQRSWQGNEVGLAGPKAKKHDLSGEKLEWIEGMMKQARTVSGNFFGGNTPVPREERAESRSDSCSESRTGTRNREFVDLGKVGGTKRIFLRGGRPSLE